MPISKKLKPKFGSSKSKEKPEYWLTRYIILRFLGFIYFFAFLSLAVQVIPLMGENGLLPAKNFLETFQFEGKLSAFWHLPTIFWFYISDNFLLLLAWVGVILSIVVILGFANIPIMFLLWFIYMSFVHIGQTWYSYGWEIQLIETGFLAMFLCPLWNAKPFPGTAPPKQVIWLFRWLAFRINLGAGLIKIRGDNCWKDLTCLYYHYETQPIPNPLSRYFYFMPKWFHRLGVIWNHFIELIVPWFVFWPRVSRYAAGILLISFQFILILSGNLSFLNYLTILPAIACFDDKFFKIFLPRKLIKKAEFASQNQVKFKIQPIVVYALIVLIVWLSIPVVQNLMSSRQIMNTSFNQWDLVNTYGAFGSVGKERYELILEGTTDEFITDKTEWREYEFVAKPGNISRPFPLIAPYQPRIDWQIWFAAFERPENNPWLMHLIWKLLDNDKNALSLLAYNPFPDKNPKYIRVQYYRYKFAKPGDKNYWERTYVGQWLPPLSKETKGFKEYIENNGWKN